MNPIPKRRLGWKILAGVVGAIALGVGAAAIWTSLVAERRAIAMEKEVAALREEIEKRNPPRSPLRGELLEGNAWADYDLAFIAVPRADKKTINEVYAGRMQLEPAMLDELIASGDAAFDLFRRGTRRSRGAYSYAWEQGWTGKCPSMFDCQTLANFAAVRARRLLEEGKARQAAELMLDTCRLGQDLSTRAPLLLQWIGAAIYNIAFLELLTTLKSKDLAREDLLAIDHELELVAKEWPEVDDNGSVDALMTGYELQKPWADRSAEARATLAESWRFAFSRRIAEIDAFDQVRGLARDLAGISRRPWHEACQIANEVEARAYGNRNRLVWRCIQWSASNIEMDRELQTHLQLLRGAARFRATGEVPILDDPFGSMLRTELRGNRLKIWSVGPDGVDDGGSGEWKRKAGKDIVLEVER
jgi:hypothetical protein